MGSNFRLIVCLCGLISHKMYNIYRGAFTWQWPDLWSGQKVTEVTQLQGWPQQTGSTEARTKITHWGSLHPNTAGIVTPLNVVQYTSTEPYGIRLKFLFNLQACQKTLDKWNAFQPYKRERERDTERERWRERETQLNETQRWRERPVDDSLTECKSSMWWNVDRLSVHLRVFPLLPINNHFLSQGPAIIAPLNDKLFTRLDSQLTLKTISLIDRGCADSSSSDILWMPLCISARYREWMFT